MQQEYNQQKQALQGQMLASMGAVKFDVGLSEMGEINEPSANFQLQANLNDVYLGWGNLGFALIGQTEVLNIGSPVKFVSPSLLAIENPPGGMSGQNTWDPVDNVLHTRMYAFAMPEPGLKGPPNSVQGWNQNSGNRNRLYFGYQMVDYTGQPQWYYGSIPSNTAVIWAR